MIAHDVIIVGSGLAGMRCAIELRRKAPQADIAIVTKVYPTRSHSGAAQGGVAAALGNVRYDESMLPVPTSEEQPGDEWVAHLYDTVKGADFLGDQDAQEIMCREAVPTIYELEHMGVPFSRLPDGRIAQRPFGGHSNPRACYAADRTGHAILHTLYGELVRYNVKVYPESYMLGVVIDDNVCRGVSVLDIRTGDIDVISAKATMFATGGYGRAFKITSNSYASTGDGITAAYRAGVPLEDMEFVQFHPTGLYSHGILLSEGARGEGGYLLNGNNERFMARYAPGRMELAPRDVVSRSIYSEIEAGRGAGPNGDYVLLDLRHLGKRKLDERLPQITELARDYLGVDPVAEPVPIQPTAHYSMGGIPTDADGRVMIGDNEVVYGFFAAGECACVSVHGANRLGTNSLLEATTYGRRTGQTIADFLNKERPEQPPMPAFALREAQDEVEDLLSRTGQEIMADIRRDLQSTMFVNSGVFRTPDKLTQQLGVIQDLRERFGRISLDDKSRRYNTELIEVLELAHLLEFSECIVAGALAREESRGAHARRDFPKRDDANWMKHTLAYRQANGRPRLDYKAVRYGPNGPRFQPEERK
ncbi:MAG TPA: succinate dehydrogenase flavoprotein subunit, partial [Herpetosiphonaceae bacterium]|nr:succinate dehydrogenase flavoprotein subunit [Herpetosiphonaceae bacterium]